MTTSRPNGVPCWLDLGTSDKDASKAFYGALFGWTAEDHPEFGGYTNFHKDGKPVAGAMQNDGSMGPDGWTAYLATDDIVQVGAAAPAVGGQLAMGPDQVGALGTMAFLSDPGGASIGAWQAGEHLGFADRALHGTPGWFELWTRDFPGSIEFYRQAFGAEITIVSDADEFRYAIIKEGDDDAAGIMDASAFLPEGVPAHWSVYVAVDSTDEAIAHAIELGGSVVQPAEDTPYGRLATLTDTTGATFKLVQNDGTGE